MAKTKAVKLGDLAQRAKGAEPAAHRRRREQSTVLFIELSVREDSDGMFAITSPQLPGFTVIHHDLRQADREMPELLSAELRSRAGQRVFVTRASRGPSADMPMPPWAAIPAAVAAKAMAYDDAGDD